MLKRLLITTIFYYAACLSSSAQFTRYLVKFTDKSGSSYSLANPASFLSQRAIDRRIRYQLRIDSSDLPVNPGYILQLAAIPQVTILNISRWFNTVAIQTSDPAAITSINALPFVQKISGIAARTISNNHRKIPEEDISTTRPSNSMRPLNAPGDYYNYGANAQNEMNFHHGNFLHNIGLRGQGMQTALIDAGFYHYSTLSAFDSVNINGQVLATWDFVAHDSSVVNGITHGMACLSTMAANLPGQFVGTSPLASFYLFRTEDVSSEYPVEEFNWVCAAERADSSGADVISSSLGYTTFDSASLNHTYADMNGHTTIAAKGASLAAQKGLLVFIAAGNEGNSPWHYIMTPADADSVISVGAVDTTGRKGNFSSYGPSADGRVKPDLMSIGLKAVIFTSSNLPGISQGTSYACPKLAGLGTCLWQGFPEFGNMKIIDALKQSGNSYNQPTDSLGYGVPNVKSAFSTLLIEYAESAVTIADCKASLNWFSKDAGSMRYEIERKAPGDTGFVYFASQSGKGGPVLSNQSYQVQQDLLNVNAGLLQYRIKQIIDTSTSGFRAAYIDTASIALTAGCQLNPGNITRNHISISPNPVGGNLNLIVETPAAASTLLIKIYDMQGRLMIQQKESKEAGKASFILDTDRLARGKYNLAVYTNQTRLGLLGFVKL